MKDSYEKDPFAEYDKYWDELEKQEDEIIKKQEKEYRFEDTDASKYHFEKNPEMTKKFVKLFIGFIFFFVFYLFLRTGKVYLQYISTPFIVIGVFSVLFSFLSRNKHN